MSQDRIMYQQVFPTDLRSPSPNCFDSAQTFCLRNATATARLSLKRSRRYGMVGATIQHLNSLRRMVDDEGWIRTLMEEAENERMHLMTFVAIARPTVFERLVVLFAQWIFYAGFFLLYLVSSRTAHRVVGYFEEEAVLSYTLYLAEIDAGRVANVPAPAIAKRYWKLPAEATLRDVVLVVRADEAHHRDVNHGFASELAGDAVNHAHDASYTQHDDRFLSAQPAASEPSSAVPLGRTL